MGTSRKEVTMTVPWGCPPPEQSREQICVVDDDEWVADSLKLLLETLGYDVQSYNSGAGLLADDRRRAAGCLIIDQHMPHMDGLDLVDRLQKEGVRVPMILISGRLDTNTKQRAASLGITSVLEKPFAADRLVDLIQTVLLERN
jgi:FixJ family two-component response regulator